MIDYELSWREQDLLDLLVSQYSNAGYELRGDRSSGIGLATTVVFYLEQSVTVVCDITDYDSW